MGQTHSATPPTAIYGVSLLMPAIAFCILQTTVLVALVWLVPDRRIEKRIAE